MLAPANFACEELNSQNNAKNVLKDISKQCSTRLEVEHMTGTLEHEGFLMVLNVSDDVPSSFCIMYGHV